MRRPWLTIKPRPTQSAGPKGHDVRRAVLDLVDRLYKRFDVPDDAASSEWYWMVLNRLVLDEELR